MRPAVILVSGFGLLAGCTTPVQQSMPVADSSPETVTTWGGVDYQVRLQEMAQAQGGVVLSLNRVNGKALDYSDGKLAKDVAEFFCGSRGRRLNSVAYGHFNALGSWMFEGGCV